MIVSICGILRKLRPRTGPYLGILITEYDIALVNFLSHKPLLLFAVLLLEVVILIFIHKVCRINRVMPFLEILRIVADYLRNDMPGLSLLNHSLNVIVHLLSPRNLLFWDFVKMVLG